MSTTRMIHVCWHTRSTTWGQNYGDCTAKLPKSTWKSISAKQKKYASTPPTTNHSFLMTNKLSKYQNFPIISKDNGGADRDVAERIKKARGAFETLNTVWRSTTYSNNTKIRIFNTNVKSVLLYGCETWKLTTTHHTSTPKFSSIDASPEYWKYSGWSRCQTKNCEQEPSKGQLN